MNFVSKKEGEMRKRRKTNIKEVRGIKRKRKKQNRGQIGSNDFLLFFLNHFAIFSLI